RSAQPVAGSTTQVISSIDANCATGTPPTSGGGTSIGFLDQNGNAVTYTLTGASCSTAGCDLQKNGNTVIGGVQRRQIWRYDNSTRAVLSATMANIREIRIQIPTKTERGAGTGTAGDQHAVVESRVRFRNI